MLFAWPEAIPVRWSDIQISAKTFSHYREIIQHLYDLTYHSLMDPQVLTFTPEAQQDFIAWHDLHMEELEHQTLSPFLQGVYAKGGNDESSYFGNPSIVVPVLVHHFEGH